MIIIVLILVIITLFFFNRENVFVRARLLQSCLTLCNPMDCSLPASSDRGTLQARILECYALWSHHFMGNRWGNSGNSVRLYFGGALKSLQMLISANKLKDTYSLEGKL